MTNKISINAIRKHLPHVDIDNLGSRPLPLHCMYDENDKWHMWLPYGEDDLIEMKGIPVEARYFSKKPANEGDIRIRFIEFLDQRASTPDTVYLAQSAFSDIQNLSVSIAKLEMAFSCRDMWPGVHRMAATELEYIFLTCRSLFDILQAVITSLWNRIRITDPSLKKRELPSRFSRIAMHNRERRSTDGIIEKYQIPRTLAEAYHEAGSFFEWLRQYRDYIAHSGMAFDRVLVVDKGFAISFDSKPFSEMDIWDEQNSLPNNLGSLKSAACYVIYSTLEQIENIIKSLEGCIKFPLPIVPEYGVFICGENIKYLSQVRNAINENPWYNIDEITD